MRRTMEQFTPEEKSHMQANRNVNREEWIKEHPARESTGLIALPDLGKGLYQGEQGGLYPDGENAPPAAHLKAGLKLARQIVPRDAEGNESKDGKIVLISIGMSNTTMKFQTFQKLAAGDTSLNKRLVILDGAQGGQVAWVTSKPTTPFWDVVDERIKAAGVTRKQVQAAWVLQANPGPQAPVSSRGQGVATEPGRHFARDARPLPESEDRLSLQPYLCGVCYQSAQSRAACL